MYMVVSDWLLNLQITHYHIDTRIYNTSPRRGQHELFLTLKCNDNVQYIIYTNLIAFEVGPSAGSKTLLTAEALELWSHTQRVAFYTFLLAPHTYYLHILYIFHCRREIRRKAVLDDLKSTRIVWNSYNWVLFSLTKESALNSAHSAVI